MNARSAMLPPSNKHKPSGCKLPLPPPQGLDGRLTLSVPEPATKQRKTLMERAGDFPQKPAAPPNRRPGEKALKDSISRSFGASASRSGQNKTTRSNHAASISGSVGPGVRLPSVNTRPKSAMGHGRSKSHSQDMRPSTAMRQREEDHDDDGLERKGVHPFSTSTIPTIPTIPKDALHVRKNALVASNRRPNSLTVPSKGVFLSSESRSVSSPSTLRMCTPVKEEPTDDSCDDFCNTLGELKLSASKTAIGDRCVACGVLPGKEINPFLVPPKPPSQIPKATPVRQLATPTPIRPPVSTPRSKAPFLNRFTNDRCPDFYDDRVGAIEREFAVFKEQILSETQKSTDYKETIQQLQARGMYLEAHDCAGRGGLNVTS